MPLNFDERVFRSPVAREGEVGGVPWQLLIVSLEKRSLSNNSYTLKPARLMTEIVHEVEGVAPSSRLTKDVSSYG